MPRVVASIEARTGSSRLPGKVLMDVNGKPALSRLLRRLRLCNRLDDIILATTTNAGDDVLEQWAQKERVLCFRGSDDDVLGRVVGAQRHAKSDIVVEICGDCILTDPEVVDMCVETFFFNDCDVVSNQRKPAFPMGAHAQVFRLADLQWVADNIDDPAVREHVSLYFYEHPERYRLIHLYPPKRWHAPQYRFQLDYPEDLEFIREIYKRLEPRYGDSFGLAEIMHLIGNEPGLPEINMHCQERSAR